MCADIGGGSSNYAIFIIENVEPIGKDSRGKSLPRKDRKANLLRRQAIISSVKCYWIGKGAN
jgi:hypothetical protein